MNSPDFFRTVQAKAIIERAACISQIPISVHFVGDGEEGKSVAGAGACASCTAASSTKKGLLACRRSRREPSTDALEFGGPVPFVCHLGFACVCAPLASAPGFVVTFGPYCPAGTSLTLDDVVRAGLGVAGLTEQRIDAIEFDDVRHAAPESVVALADWVVDSLESAYGDWAADTDNLEDPAAPTDNGADPNKRRRRRREQSTPAATAIAAALASRHQTLARALMRNLLEEAASVNSGIRAIRARTISTVFEILESAERSRLNTERCWQDISEVVASIERINSVQSMADLAIRFIISLAVPRRHAAVKTDLLRSINAAITPRLKEGVALKAVAAEIGVQPSTVSRLLRTRFDLTYKQYLGRLRIEEAKRLIRHTKLDTRELAQRLGISDPSNFTRLFRRFEGVTPAEYRQRHG